LRIVAEKNSKMIRIKWVRSGIGFTYRQKTIVRSLGLNKLNHTVLRPDTPQIRGIVAAVPHMLVIVPEPVAPAWASIPEYTVTAPPPDSAAPSEIPSETASAASTEAVATEEGGDETTAPAKRAKAKSPRAGKKKESAPEKADLGVGE
jgi:large subunit ribosomal protein L30